MTTECHQITKTDHMFSVGETPWHKLGTVLPAGQTLTSAEALKAARLTWRVDLRSVFTRVDDAPVDVPMARAVVRDDTGDVLGCVGTGFRPLQNEQAFAAFDPYVQAGVMRYETAGSLRGGARVWILARLLVDNMEIGKGDALQPYALLAHGHDGSLAIRVQPTAVRVVCRNTLHMAMAAATFVRVQHRGNAEAKATEAVASLDNVRAAIDKQAAQYREIANRGASMQDVARYLAAVWRKPLVEIVGGKDPSDGTKTIEPNARALEIGENFGGAGEGSRLASADGTWWGVYNALTQVLTHGTRGSSSDAKAREKRADSSAWGTGADTSRRGIAVAYAMGVLGGKWSELAAQDTAEIEATIKAHAAKAA